jgi:hypothetical protein
MVPVLLAALTGCDPAPAQTGAAAFVLDAELSCDVDYLSWTGDLTYAILQGSGDGAFDYDPPGDVESKLTGQYDLATGDFSYDVEYDPEHYRVSSVVSGYGYAAENGDLDIEYSVVTEDLLGDTWTVVLRLERVGCDVTTQWFADDGTYYERQGAFAAEGFAYTQTVDALYAEGLIRPDLTRSETKTGETASGVAYDGASESDGNGYTITDWVQVNEPEDWTAIGYDESFLDGSSHRHYEFDSEDDYTWDQNVDYAGDGAGTYVGDGFTCDLRFVDWVCTYDCDGQTGSCS